MNGNSRKSILLWCGFALKPCPPSPQQKKEADLLLFPHSQELSTSKDTFSVGAVAYITDGRN
jgi:hypothetical protein